MRIIGCFGDTAMKGNISINAITAGFYIFFNMFQRPSDGCHLRLGSPLGGQCSNLAFEHHSELNHL